MIGKIHGKAGGYSMKLFVGKSHDELEEVKCGICLEVCRNPKQCPNGHMYCDTCTQTMKKRGAKCPNCRVSVSSWNHNLFAKNGISKMTVKCASALMEGHSNGTICDWQGPLSALERHVSEECLMSLVACRFDGCGKQMMRTDIIVHEPECCFRLVTCVFCNAVVTVSVQADHEAMCAWRTVICDQNCGMRMYTNQLELHKTNDCPNTLMDCSMFQLVGSCRGCDGKVFRSNAESHLICEDNLAGNFTALLNHCIQANNRIDKQTLEAHQVGSLVEQRHAAHMTEWNAERVSTRELLSGAEQKFAELASEVAEKQKHTDLKIDRTEQKQVDTDLQFLRTEHSLVQVGLMQASVNHELDECHQTSANNHANLSAELSTVKRELQSTKLNVYIASLQHKKEMFVTINDLRWQHDALLCKKLERWSRVFDPTTHAHVITYLNKQLNASASVDKDTIVRYLVLEVRAAELSAGHKLFTRIGDSKVSMYPGHTLSVFVSEIFSKKYRVTIETEPRVYVSKVSIGLLGPQEVTESNDFAGEYWKNVLTDTIDGTIRILCTLHVKKSSFERATRDLNARSTEIPAAKRDLYAGIDEKERDKKRQKPDNW